MHLHPAGICTSGLAIKSRFLTKLAMLCEGAGRSQARLGCATGRLPRTATTNVVLYDRKTADHDETGCFSYSGFPTDFSYYSVLHCHAKNYHVRSMDRRLPPQTGIQ